MNTTDKGQSAEHENLARDQPETRFWRSRRSLLSGAASGVALAASGLLLPEWLVEEAAADTHPVRGVQDRKDQKRQKQRHKREHNRTVKRRRQQASRQDTPRGSGSLIRDVAILVHNYRPFGADVQGWQFAGTEGWFTPTYEVPKGWDWSTIPGRTGVPHFTKDFVGTENYVIVRIGGDRVVFASNIAIGFPTAYIRTGGWNKYGQGNDKGQEKPGKFLAQADFTVNHTIAAEGIRITRVDDTDNHIRFSVDLT
jgi:hypothetical protein